MKKPSSNSAILRFLRFLTDFFYHAIGVGFFGRICTSYHAMHEGFASTATGRIGTGNGRMRRRVRQSLVLAMDENAVVRGARFLKGKLLHCSLRTIGLFFLVTGAYTSVMYWLTAFVWRTDTVSGLNLVAGIVIAVVGTLMLFSEVSLGYAIHRGVLFGLLARIFDLSDENLQYYPRTGGQYYVVAVPLGMVVGALGALFDPMKILFGAFCLCLAGFVLSVPEAGVLFLLLATPFVGFLSVGRTVLTILALLPLVGYLLKLVRGNRTFRLQLQDLPVFFCMLTVLLSGASFAKAGAFGTVLQSMLLIAVYVLLVNMIATPGWLLRCRVALLLSASVSAGVGLLQFVVAATAGAPPFGAARAGFADATGFAYFLLLAYPFALYTFFTCRKYYRLAALSSLLFIAGGAVLSGVQSAALAIALMTVVFLLFYEKIGLFTILTGGGVLAVVAAILPSTARAWLDKLFLEDPMTVPVEHIFRSVEDGGIGFGVSRLLFGLGQGGVEQFSRLFAPHFAVITAQNTNFFTYMLCQYGLVGLLPPLIFLLFLLQNSCSIFTSGSFGEKRYAALPGLCLVIGVLVNMFFHYTWWDPAAMLMFFAVTGLAAAELKQERYRHSRIERPQYDGSGAECEFYIS